jgi:transposase
MNASGAALQGKHTGEASELYMAFELSEKNWKLSLSDGSRSPSRYSVIAGETAGLLECIAKAKARCGLAPQARVHSCYEAGRDGFWLHRWLIEQGIDNIVVDSSSIEVNRHARRAKTDRLDRDKLLAMLPAPPSLRHRPRRLDSSLRTCADSRAVRCARARARKPPRLS